jgi:hypothetical protein
MTTLLNFEISDINGKALTCQCTEADAVITILALLGLTGDELMLDTDDCRDYDWYDAKDGGGRSVYTSTEIIEGDLDCTGTDVYFNHYTDISSLVASGAWLVRNDHAYHLKTWPIGKARKHIKRRGDFKEVRKLYPSWLGKLKQLERLGNQPHEQQEMTA